MTGAVRDPESGSEAKTLLPGQAPYVSWGSWPAYD